MILPNETTLFTIAPWAGSSTMSEVDSRWQAGRKPPQGHTADTRLYFFGRSSNVHSSFCELAESGNDAQHRDAMFSTWRHDPTVLCTLAPVEKCATGTSGLGNISNVLYYNTVTAILVSVGITYNNTCSESVCVLPIRTQKIRVLHVLKCSRNRNYFNSARHVLRVCFFGIFSVLRLSPEFLYQPRFTPLWANKGCIDLRFPKARNPALNNINDLMPRGHWTLIALQRFW